MSKKGQSWIPDFFSAILIFTIMVILFFQFVVNTAENDELIYNEIKYDSQTIAQSLSLEGYPANWNNVTVMRLGITNADGSLNVSKLEKFNTMDYMRTRLVFGTSYDYLVYFLDNNDAVLNIEGICASGYNVTYEYNTTGINLGYYYNSDSDSFMKPFMEELGAVVYKKNLAGFDTDDFLTDIMNFTLAVVEDPHMQQSNLENMSYYVEQGGLVFLSEHLANPNQVTAIGAFFDKGPGESLPEANASVVYEDETLGFELNENLVVSQVVTVTDVNSTDFQNIAVFTGTGKGDVDGYGAIASWTYGTGNVYYFSDFDGTYRGLNISEHIRTVIPSYVFENCLTINITDIEVNNLAKTERVVMYDTKALRMVTYVWN